MMEFVSTEASHVEGDLGVTSQPPNTSSCDDVDNERSDGIFDYTNNNNNNNNSENEKERRREGEVTDAAPMSPESGDEQLSGGASPLTPDSSPRGSSTSLVDDIHAMETSTPLKHICGGVDTDSAHLALCRSADLTDRGSDEKSSAASDYGTPSNSCFPDAAAIYQQYATLKTSPFLGTAMSSPSKGVVGLGSGVRCPPVREAVDPAKYITISGEPDGVKYACSKCGNIYKWRKSLNKHWKEKHDGEAPDPAAVGAAANRYVRMPTPLSGKRPSPAPYSGASSSGPRPPSSATRPAGVRGSLAAILPPLPGQSDTVSLRVTHDAVNGRGWNQSSESLALHSPQLKTPTFADYKTSSSVTASPFSVLAIDSMSSKERPVDLSGSASRAQTSDEYADVLLDLSKKGVAPYVSQSCSVQDEPIDFSTKTASQSARNPILEPGLYRAGRQLEVAHAGSVAVTTSLNCAQCRQKFTVPSKLNRHFADAHSNLLQVPAAVDASEVSCGGSTQLFRYLTNERAAYTEAIRCVVCGVSFFFRSAAARHFDQEHVGLYPNPYQPTVSGTDGNAGSSTQRRQAEQQLPGAGNHLRCGRCPFTTDSFSVLARHHLRHSPRRPSDLMTPEVSRIIWGGAGDAELPLLSGTTVNMDDVIGENTAIVIPQAPEDSSPAVAASSSTLPTKPLKQASSGGRSSGGRTKRSDAAGSSTASAETLLPFKCDLCEYRARWPSEMTQHAKNHSDEKPYHCPQCTYRSKWKWDVVKHLKRCGGGGTARDVIDTTSMSSSSSSVATAAAAAAAVSQTARRRTNVRSLLIDVPPPDVPSSYQRATGSVTENSTRPPGVTSTLPSTVTPHGPPNVMICSRAQDKNSARPPANDAVQTAAEAATTTVKVRPANSASPTPAVVSLVNQGLHYCLQCSFVGHSPAELRRHLRVHSDEKPYSCRTCCYSSKWKCDLKKHLRAYNHVSAVPLAYGGHGRKPSADWQPVKDGIVDVAADDELSGPADDGDYTAAETSATPDSGDQSGVVSSLKSDVKDSVLAKTQKVPNGSNFAGITVGGRLRCRRCDFEAIDLTSFLQHKSTHAAVRKDDKGDTADEHAFGARATAATRPSHHRRKSSKQVRVVPESKTDKYAKTVPVGDHGHSTDHAKLPNDDRVNVPDAADGSKFWTSLGLRSKNVVNCLQSAETVDMKGSSVIDMKVDNHQNEEQTTATEADLETASQSVYDAGVHETADVVADTVTPSPASSSSSDTDVDLVDVDQPVDLCRRRASPNVTKLDAEEVPSSQAVQQLSNVAERITTTEADDATGMSKRKRKLRTCDKCGYVTDNLTTLQRHAAKHGSAGRHRCSQCDYTVDRQHILDYHVKNVHVSVLPTVPSADTTDDQKGHSDVYAQQLEQGEARCTTDAAPPVKRRRTQRASTDQVYRCVSCGYSGHSVAALARHHLRHSAWSLPYRCQQCSHRATTRRLLATHSRKHDALLSPSSDQQHACAYCPYKSSSASHVAAHERFHGARRRYRCPYCSYSLDRRRLLSQHRRLHARDCGTGVPLRCRHDGCPFTCYDRDQLRSHDRQHAVIGRCRPYACERCSFTVDSRNALLRHQRMHVQRQCRP